MAREDKIARGITHALFHSEDAVKARSAIRSLRRVFKALFTLSSIQLHQHEPELFSRLREDWQLDATSYIVSFLPADREGNQSTIQAKGDMGYSGSTFFNTADEKYLIKSVPRRFENTFFRDDLLRPYIEYMSSNLDSLLIRIMDFLAVDDAYKLSPGVTLGFAPSHHIIMENLLVGQGEGERKGKAMLSKRSSETDDEGDTEESKQWKWESWDLKPTTYFFPERDIAQGKLTSEATKSKLADEFKDKLVLTKSQSDNFLAQLTRDTELLKEANAVDYSLFLVRIPVHPPEQEPHHEDSDNADPFSDDAAYEPHDTASPVTAGPDLAPTAPTPSSPPFTPPNPPTWRTGIKSADGKYIYRAAILDFFWAKHKLQAKMMTHLVKAWNKVGNNQGPMSITTTSSEYKERFMSMCEGFVQVREDDAVC